MGIKEDMINEIRTQLSKEYMTLDEFRDNIGEWVDGYIPVYNNQIIQSWQAMPSEYDDRGGAELGHGEEVNIINLMSLDLYLYYTDLFNEALTEVEESLEEASA